MQISTKQSNTFWQLKAFAIFTVFFAHMPAHIIKGSSILVNTFDVIGMFGVPLFILIAGYFDYSSKSSLIKKTKNLFIPLLVWGSFTFLIHILKEVPSNVILDYLKWIYGCKSWLYFVPVLFWCIVLSRIFDEWICLLLGLLSTLLTSKGVLVYSDYFTVFENPLNFILYFSTGRLINRYYQGRGIEYNYKHALLSLVIMVVFFFYKKPTYCTPYTVIFTLASFVLSFYVFSKFDSKLFISIGKISFVIYLCHIQIAGFIQMLLKPIWGTI